MSQDALLKMAEKYIPGACVGSLYLPANLRMVMTRAEGSKLYDAGGKEYIDCMLGSGPLVIGNSHPQVVEAVQRQAALGSTYYALNEPAVKLAAKIVEAAPCGETMRFQTTGSDATEGALRIARAATGRQKVLKFEGGFNGGHDSTQFSRSSVEDLLHPESVPDSDGVPESLRQDTVIAPFNDPETTVRLIEEHRNELAAVIIEPLQRSLKPEPGFLEAVRAATEKHGIVFIFDEIVTGFRLAWGGAQERYGVVPDLACYGKAVGGGYPVSAIVGRAALMKLADPGKKGQGGPYCFLSGTMTANPIACVAGLVTLEVLEQPGTYERLFAIGERLADGIRKAARKVGVPVLVAGDGPVLQVHFTDRKELRNHRDLLKTDTKKGSQFGLEMISRGVYFTPGSKIYLSLAHTDRDIERTIEAAEDSLKAVA
ncbi:MAG: aspartate aminotransferase family protein [Rhodospirillales bacterium]|nr:aspartate aminotransferase family protein [Rhodospirillales bacterium]